MFANVKMRFTHLVWNVIEFEQDHTNVGPAVWLGMILAFLAAVFGPVYALVYLLSGDATWGVTAGIAVLTLATGTFYCLLGVDETS